MERSYIKNINSDFIKYMELTNESVQKIYSLVTYAIKEKLYTHSKVLYHNLEHIERTLIYAYWIMQKKHFLLQNEDILLYALLYHDAGRVKICSNKMHGIKGAEIAKLKLKDVFDAKQLEAISLLIKNHASKSDILSFTNGVFTEEEQAYLQELANIVKDADALDRNRLKLFPFAMCNPNFLRSEESKEIYKSSNRLLQEYELAKKKVLKNG